MKKTKHPETKKLVLLDAHAIIHRAYHALPDFSSSKGEPTGALYGLSSMLLKIIAELKPDYMAACYDLPEPTYRHQAYEEYKAGREAIDDDLASQIERSREIFKAFSIPIYEHAGFEADDLLGTIAKRATEKPSIDVVIASGDMDTLQLVSGKKVQVYTLKKGIRDTILYDEEAVVERFGFPPNLLADYKGLRGDPSDNIIGIAGIGEKTATELIQKFGSIEEMYKTLNTNEKKFEKNGIKPRIINLLKENEEEALFSKMLAEIRLDVPTSFSLPKVCWEESFSPSSALELFSELNFRSLAERVKKTFSTTEELFAQETKAEDVPERDLKEASVALWVLSSDITNPTLDDILAYGKTDSFAQARERIFADLAKNKGEQVYKEIERPLIPIIDAMKARGILIDSSYLLTLSKEYHKELSKIERRIYKHAGEEFNVNSPRQLGEVLFEKMGLSVKNQKRTGTGQKSTRESELEKMRDLHPVIEDILSYRELQKLLSTYIDNLPHMTEGDNRLHADFLQAGTTTGRMSSQNPNLQNIPIRSDLGRKIRHAFIAPRGSRLVALDYSQIELRVAAFLSGDAKLIEIFKSGGDVHTAVASEVFGVKESRVDVEMRRKAKVINFGILYGMGVNALRQNLGTTRAEAQAFYTEYFEQFQGLAEYFEDVKATTHRLGYTETYFGRRRYFEAIRSRVPHLRAQAERMAINAPIQGTEADVIKIAMARIDDYLKKNKKDDTHLLLQVHDELVYEIPQNEVEETASALQKIMESVLTRKETKGVPIIVDTKAGKSWGEMTPLRKAS